MYGKGYIKNLILMRGNETSILLAAGDRKFVVWDAVV